MKTVDESSASDCQLLWGPLASALWSVQCFPSSSVQSCPLPPEMKTMKQSRFCISNGILISLFPFPVYHILIRSPHTVNSSIQLHLLKHTQTLLSIWNMLRRLRKTSVFTVQKSNLASGASYYLSPLGQKKMKYLPQGLLIPHLFVLPLQFSKTRLSQSLLRPRTTRWKEKCTKSLFCRTFLIHSNRPDLLE